MTTWLANEKMPPELRARIEASVRGRGGGRTARLSPRQVMCVRLLALFVTMAALIWLGVSKRRVDRELEAGRAALLARWQRNAGNLTERDRRLTERVQQWLGRMTGHYTGDFVSVEVSADAALDAWLERPIVYVRGSSAALKSSAGTRTSAGESVKDAFVLCLLDPPRDETETAILSRVRAAYGASERMRQKTDHVERLGAALRGLPTLLPSFRDGIVAADDHFELERYERAFDAAPLGAARRALGASLLLVLIDEPGDPKAPTELDGERPHPVRVGLVDLTRGHSLFLLRRTVDPSFLSEVRRPAYARGADGCRLALDVREAVHDG